MFGRKRIKELEKEAVCYERAKDYWYEQFAGERARRQECEAEAERAKKKCTECVLNKADYIGVGLDGRTYILNAVGGTTNSVKCDPEAERVAKLPKCGSTKKCPACGKEKIGAMKLVADDFATGKELPTERQYMRTRCEACGNLIQERPLFNKGK